MAFYDDFGKKVTQMSQDAVAKVKNLTDQAKLRSQISEEEKKISGNYCKIGELFYGVRGKENLPEYPALMDEIDASKERIVELNHQLQIVKGMVVCPKCGAEVSIHAAFCPSCGTKMPQEESAEETATEAEAQEEEEEPAEEKESAETQEKAKEGSAEAQEENAEETSETEPQEENAEEAATEAEPQEENAEAKAKMHEEAASEPKAQD